MIKKIFRIANMECPACALRLEGLEDDLPGIQQINASYHKQTLMVAFDETVIREAEIVAAVGKLGYTVRTE
ncbi:MAG TPA: cation transporter [Anaerolineaceae bacterium]|jgi:copper chaperone CopZ|nr:cation transporter [Anaerolineaceae bacterium]